MSASALIMDRELRCRCGQVGVITGVEGDADRPETIWISHMVRLKMETHIHRTAQMPALLAQVSRS